MDFLEPKCIMCGKSLKKTHRQALGFCKDCQAKMSLYDDNTHIDRKRFGINWSPKRFV